MTKKYKAYKSSGVEWIGEIPEHWEVMKISHLFKERREKVSDKDYEPLSVTKFGIFPQLDSVAKTNAGDNRKRVCKGDFVINSRSDRKGSSGISIYDGSVSLISIVLEPIGLTTDFTHYLLKSYYFKEEFYRYGKGIVEDLWSTNYSEMKKISILNLPIFEQQKIALYLDEKSEEIDKFIKNKEQLINLLEEEKKAIITNAVTKGIDKNVKFKNSGVDWLDKIPVHWKLRRVATFGRFSKGSGLPKSDLVENGVPAILYGDIYTKYNLKAVNIINHVTKKSSLNAKEITKGDILFTGSGETKEDIGKCIVYLGNESIYAGGDIIILHQKIHDSLFLSYSLNSDLAVNQKIISAKGEIIVHIYSSKIKEIYIPIPPLEEQKEIVSYLENQTKRIDDLKAKYRQEIDLIKEYKERLIYDVVTGKMNVLEH